MTAEGQLDYDHLLLALGSVTNFHLSNLRRFEEKVRGALDCLLDIVFSKAMAQVRARRAAVAPGSPPEPRSPAPAGHSA
jgi:hypothetical protein